MFKLNFMKTFKNQASSDSKKKVIRKVKSLNTNYKELFYLSYFFFSKF